IVLLLMGKQYCKKTLGERVFYLTLNPHRQLNHQIAFTIDIKDKREKEIMNSMTNFFIFCLFFIS
ncbi:MAG: hypothetical protein ACFFD1_03210, partial [Candidatus Thorarchaeota archaeon]